MVKPGATVQVYQKISEGEKERVQMFQGLVIRVSAGAGVDKTFTVRKIVEGVGVEKIFPIHSPTIEKITILKQGKVRRAKLYYMRGLQGKSTRLRETELSAAIMDESAPVQEETPMEETTPEAPVDVTSAEEAPVEEEQK